MSLLGALLGCGGPATIETVATGLRQPTAVALDARGRLWIDDFNRFEVRRLEPDGALTTQVGRGEHGWAELGAHRLDTPLENPIDVAFRPDGTLLVAELHTGRVLAVDVADPDGRVALFAGGHEGQLGYAGDGGPATGALLSELRGVAAGDDGRVWLADTQNHCVRVVDADGTIDLAAGDVVPGLVDGGPEEARFAMPERLRVRDGAVWVADTQNHAIRRIDAETFEVETVAGTGVAGFGGDGGAADEALLDAPTGVWPLVDGGFVVADSLNHRVRWVDADGVITTIAGTGQPGFAGDGGLAVDARLNWPADVVADEDGTVYVADLANGAVRALRRAVPRER